MSRKSDVLGSTPPVFPLAAGKIPAHVTGHYGVIASDKVRAVTAITGKRIIGILPVMSVDGICFCIAFVSLFDSVQPGGTRSFHLTRNSL